MAVKCGCHYDLDGGLEKGYLRPKKFKVTATYSVFI